MQIKNHLLYNSDGTQVKFVQSPNIRNGLTVKYLVMHYTASDNFENVLNRFKDPNAKVSAHFVVGRAGQIGQCVSLDKVAFHAGTSQWKNIDGLNGHSFGIEMSNFGPLTKKGTKFYSWTNKEIAGSDVFTDSKGKHWQVYPHAQLEVVYDLAAVLVKQYKLVDLLDHELIAPGRKQDSGPAFPLDELRFKLFGRKNTL